MHKTTTFDPNCIRMRDVPAALWYVATRIMPAALVVGFAWWALVVIVFLL